MCSQNYATEIVHCSAVRKQTRQCNVMSSCWIRQARHTHSMKERKRKNKCKIARENKILEKAAVLPPRRKCGSQKTKPLHINRIVLRTKGNNRQTEAQEPREITGKPKRNTLQVAAAVCGTSSIARFYLLVGLVPCYPACRLRPAFVNYTPPPERMRLTIRNKQNRLVIHPRHKTPVMRTNRKRDRGEILTTKSRRINTQK